MIDDANRDELIEHYLRGELNGDMLERFKKKLDTDDQFRNEVALQKAIIRNIKSHGREEWAIKLKILHNQVDFQEYQEEHVSSISSKAKPVKSNYRNKYFLAVAASLIFIISSTVIYLSINNRQDSERLFISYYKPYPNLEQNTRTVPTGSPTERKIAFEAYSSGKYHECIRLFNNILLKGEDELILFYLGNAYLSSDNTIEAESTFKEYLTKYKEFETESKWYLSLSYLKQGKVEDAKRLLYELDQRKNDYSKEANEILKKL